MEHTTKYDIGLNLCAYQRTANCGVRTRMSFRKFGRLFCWLIKPNPFHVASAGKINAALSKQSNNMGRGENLTENLTFLMCKSFVCVINMKHNVTKLQQQ